MTQPPLASYGCRAAREGVIRNNPVIAAGSRLAGPGVRYGPRGPGSRRAPWLPGCTAVLAAALLFFPACPPPAWAQNPPRVLIFGDSITLGSNVYTSYPAQLRALRPDLDISSVATPGEGTVAGRYHLRSVLQAQDYDWVLILEGVNDLKQLNKDDPRATARRLLKMARDVNQAGARAFVLTLTPVDNRHFFYDLAGFTCDVSNHLRRKLFARRSGRRQLIDLREAFAVSGWENATNDGVHPTDAGHTLIARFLADKLPPAD